MRTAKLFAHRDGEKLCIAEGITRQEAQDLIEEMELQHGKTNVPDHMPVGEQIESGYWPEGYEALYFSRGGRWYLFADTWERIDAWVTT